MYIKCSDAKAKDYERLATDFYLDSEKQYGSSIFRKISLKSLNDKRVPSMFLKRADYNYASTLAKLNALYKGTAKLITLNHDNGYLIAHATMDFLPTGNDLQPTPYLSDIIIRNGDELKPDPDGGINIKHGIYDQMIGFYEDLVQKSTKASECGILTSGLDGDMWIVLRSHGFDIQDSFGVPGSLMRFTKLIRERNISDGGNITLK